MRISDWSSDVCSSDLLTKFGNGGITQPMLCEFLQDKAGALPGCAPMHQALSETLIGEPVFALKAVEQLFKLLGAFGMRRQFALQLAARMLAPGKVADGSGLQGKPGLFRSEEHTSELQSLMRISYAVFCLKKNNNNN